MRLCETCALLGLLFLSIFEASECLQTVIRPDKGSMVTVSSKLDQCAVCTVSGVNDTQTSCHSPITLIPEVDNKLLFNCSQPIEQSYAVTVTRTIECTKDACSPTTAETQPSILTEFTRTFTWELKAPEKTVVSLDILGDGLMKTSQPCPNGFQYSVVTSETNSKGQTQYCQGGSLTRLDLPNQAAVSLQVKPKAQVESVLFQVSAGPLKGRTMVLTVDSSTTVVFTRDPKGPECEVCTVDGSTPNCNPTEKRLSNAEKHSLEFSCPKPQDMYSVKIKKKIECTKNSCTPAAGEIDPNPLNDFKRSLTWDISVPERTVLTLDFPGNGLKEISGTENCQDGYQYSVSTTKSDGNIKTNSYCKGGTVSHLNLLGMTTVTIEVPKEGELDQTVFSVKAAPRGSRTMSVTPDPNTMIVISRMLDEPDCSVCMNKAPKQICNPRHLRITDHGNTSVEFTCPRPQDIFNVEINREIDCTETSCSGNIVQAESSLFPDFNRTFTWDLKVVSTRAFQLDFQETGMRQIPNEETCPDEHTYSLVTYLRTGPATIGTFCKGGTVTTILARYKGRVSLRVPGDVKLNPVDFKLNVGPETSMVAIVKVNLSRGVSDTDFITANYPRDFPDNQQMQWDFMVPGMHNYTMHFRDHTAPECLSSEVEVEYKKENKKVTKLTLTDPQPEHQQGNFNMVLKNCETNRTIQGLTLKYRVSVMRSGHPVLCTVDLTKQQGVSLQIEKVGSDPYCEMSINSKVEKKINIAAGTKANLSFLDCPNEDVRLTATEVIGCQNVASCPSTLLTVPKLDSCLPMSLHSFTWHLNIPQDGTVDLVSPTGSLQQSIPGQKCDQSVSLHVSEEDGFTVGDFCFNGTIQKVQVHANVSITATAQNFTRTRGPFLNASFSQEIPETIIYRVNPGILSPTLLATPNWPQGMKPSSTMSWIVTVPSHYQAHVQFVNVSQPKCLERHTAIIVKMLGYEEELMSRREDEQAEDKLLIPQSFYLNMSNCIPEEGHFGAVTKIVLQRKTNVLAIILGIVGALLLMLIVLAVVCIITKKKKKERTNKEASIYIGKGSFFRPGDKHFTKTRPDNNSHVYDSIDEMMVYGHLLGETSYADSMQDHFTGMQADSYNTFTGPTDGQLPVIKEPDPEPKIDQYKTFLDPSETFIPSRPRTPIDRQDSLGFQDRRMVDNELYTFKSTGDINTIRLSGADMEPQPPITEESL
ncbi:CUB domain-containing protein 1-like [Seriola dumerili]|uniref:CUB domain containing protein 1 n=1 Tax=Seriola dumerili TaxID=41447 RepID=A0A3B4V8G5_SERDU|nr:CUB domain-containing protein 1-like [Seriola dumerili]